MELKGVTVINNILNEFLEQFDCSADIGEDFCYWERTSEINYAFVVASNNDIWFKEFANSLMPNLNCDIFLLSLFHEIGHHETIDDIEDDVLRECWKIKGELNQKKTFTKEDNFRYFNLPDEKAATEWGLQYMIDHKAEVADLWRKLQPAILNFYRLNDIH